MNDSSILGVSVRGLVTMVIVLTICILSGLKTEVQEPLYSMGTMALGFYFGQKTVGKGKDDETKTVG